MVLIHVKKLVGDENPFRYYLRLEDEMVSIVYAGDVKLLPGGIAGITSNTRLWQLSLSNKLLISIVNSFREIDARNKIDWMKYRAAQDATRGLEEQTIA